MTTITRCLQGVVLVSLTVPVSSARSQESASEPLHAVAPVPRDTLAMEQAILPTVPVPSWHEMFTNVPADWARSAGLTFRWESVPAISGIGIVTGALILTDDRTYPPGHSLLLRSRFVRSTSHILVRAGDGRIHLAIAGGFAAFGFIWKDDRAIRTASQTVEGLLAGGIAVQLLKHITGRESPQVATSATGRWRPFPNLRSYERNQPKYYAFPSGHITTAITTITVVAENYPDVWWIRPVGYSLTGLLGVSLVNVGYHWYSDLPLGIALGYTFGMLAAHPSGTQGDPLGRESSPHVSILPRVSPSGNGFELVLMF